MALKTSSQPDAAGSTEAGSVTSPRTASTPGGQLAGCAAGVAHEHPNLVAALQQGARDAVADLARGSGDQRAHGRPSYV